MKVFDDILRWGPVVHFLKLPFNTQASVIFVVILTLLFHIRFSHKTVAYAPTILTTTGIFFTFVGIAVGLSDFNTENLQASVPALLDGLKTAFWASVSGVGGALSIKFRHYIFGIPGDAAPAGADGEVTAQDLARLLAGIQQALVGTEEGTLISQLKLSRQDTNDRLDALKKAQLEALQKLSEMSSKCRRQWNSRPLERRRGAAAWRSKIRPVGRLTFSDSGGLAGDVRRGNLCRGPAVRFY